MMVPFVAGGLGFLAYFLVIMVTLRAISETTPILPVITGMAVVILPITVLVASLFLTPAPFWPISGAYSFLTVLFLMGFGVVFKSISVRILCELARKPDGSESYDTIMGRYVREESFHERLSTLVNSDFVREHAGLYSMTGKGRFLAGFARAIQRFFNIASSG